MVLGSHLLGDASLRSTLARHWPNAPLVLEPVEWQDLTDHFPGRTERRWRTPAALLHARYQVLPFRGRAELLAQLRDWSREPDFGARLVHGAGGQGKTRLALELAGLLAADGWAVLWLRAGAAVRDLEVLRRAAVPTLIVVDYAEMRAAQITGLLDAVNRREPGPAVKLLLLARTVGDWWHGLSLGSRVAEYLLDDAAAIELPSLETDFGSSRAEEYLQAVHGFAAGLAEVDGWEHHDWPEAVNRLVAAQRLRGHPAARPDGTVLALHMAALADLLDTAEQIAAGSESEEQASGADELEDRLLAHEERYWRALADSRGLRSFLSERRLMDALAAAFLFGAEDGVEADAILRHVPGLMDLSRDRRSAVRSWISAVAPSARSRPWDSLQPDRLAERFVGRRLEYNHTIPDAVVPAASPAQLAQLLSVYSRVATHRVFEGALYRHLVALCVRHAVALGPVAVEVATQTEAPGPLLEALHRITDAPGIPLAELERLVERLPKQSERLASWAARVTELIVNEHRALARADPPDCRASPTTSTTSASDSPGRARAWAPWRSRWMPSASGAASPRRTPALTGPNSPPLSATWASSSPHRAVPGKP
ncbi:hypothetical protein [Kitasatospora sp. NPDC057500]|uniref:P-loop NTPase n=1 Tax=Kitasatospora sp. NPDC057500 TaxID=3346151 RepID=UPI0036915B7C